MTLNEPSLVESQRARSVPPDVRHRGASERSSELGVPAHEAGLAREGKARKASRWHALRRLHPRHALLAAILRPRAGRTLPDELRAENVARLAEALPQGVREVEFQQLVGRIKTGPFHQGNQVQLFFHGEDAFASVRQAIDSATREIVLETYILNVANEYGSSRHRTGVSWRDTHVRIDGPTAWEMALVFSVEYQAAILHAKTLLADDHVSIIGSSNLDFRSFYFNAECNALILDNETGRRMAQAFDEDLAQSIEVRLQPWTQRSVTHRCGDALARRLSPML